VYERDGRWEYWGFDKARNRLNVFDLHTQRLRDSIQIPYLGPEGMPGIYDFYVHTPDSIFLHTNERKRLYLINGEGQQISRWQLPDTLPNGWTQDRCYLAAFPEGNVRFFYDERSQLVHFFIRYYDTGSAYPYDTERYTYPPLISFSLVDSSFRPPVGDFPAPYKATGFSSFAAFFPFQRTDSSWWVSYDKSHCLMRFSDAGKAEHFCLRSHYAEASYTFQPLGTKPNDRREKYMRETVYESLVMGNNTLLRIVAHGTEPFDAEGQFYRKSRAPWSIMQVDLEGNCQGEAIMPAQVYDFYDLHACQEGWLVSLENYYNPENVEDTLSLVLMSW
jgi:hypothetical protein